MVVLQLFLFIDLLIIKLSKTIDFQVTVRYYINKLDVTNHDITTNTQYVGRSMNTMSKEALQMIYSLNQDDIKTQLAIHCSPVLTGLKISNLFIVSNEYVRMVYEIFKRSPISISIIWKSEEKTTFLLYNKNRVEEYLRNKEVKEVMLSFGYSNPKLYSVLVELRSRYTKYKEEGAEFPHELGILLGYPPEDVVGFIENKGKNFLYTGYWKVYGNVQETRNIFYMFNQARENVVRMLTSGVSIQNILTMHYGSYNY